MRLGKEKASGYVADIASDSITAEEITTHPAERSQPAPVPEPVAVPALAHPAG